MKIWANSGDAHVLEPDDLWSSRMPPDLADRMPRTEQIDERYEVVTVDGRSFRRRRQLNPELTQEDLEAAGLVGRGRRAGMRAMEFFRPSWEVELRLKDLDHDGIWGEVVYPSIGLWNGLIKDPVLYREGVKVMNDWLKDTFIDVTPRSIPTAEVSIRSVEDAVAEAARVADLGFNAVSIPTMLDTDLVPWNDNSWEPFWTTCEDAGIVLTVHIGSEAKDPSDERSPVHAYHGPGAAICNYVETSYGGQRITTMLVASGVLDRHPGLKLLISEGGATWVPFVADRIAEAYRQHGIWVRPKLSRPPHEIVNQQVYASFQHDKSAVYACTAMGYPNVMWGSDYPHMEGTFGHTQKVLHELFDDVDEQARYRMTRGAFLDLFPGVGEPPEETLTAV